MKRQVYSRGTVALCAGVLFLHSAASAHDGVRHGRVISESVEAELADDSYVPPAPGTLGGQFSLLDHTGRAVTDETFRGRWMLIFLGFTGCRESCPNALLTMKLALDAMGEDADQIQPIFIDFSMEEPDLLGLAQFVSNFHPRLIGLAGDRKQTFDVVRKFRVRREYMMANYSTSETGRRIDHTTYLYLVDPEGQTKGYFHHGLGPDEYVREIRLHLDRHETRP